MTESMTGLEVAVIGMAGRFPGAADLDAFWSNLRDGIESISEVRGSRRGTLSDAGAFDAEFFGYSPHEASLFDPQHRTLLELAWHALEDAGHVAQGFQGRIGVFVGATDNQWELALARHPGRRESGALQVRLAASRDFLAGRLAYDLGLEGPACTIQTACSTSLVAIHLACQSVLSGDSDLALAGAASILISEPDSGPSLDGLCSPEGRCYAFDDRANGMVGGDGAGVVVLRRLSNALRDGDAIRAVIKGSSVNNDGMNKLGFAAPSVAGQAAVIQAALDSANVHPESIGYVEAHGTGTALGDPIEIAALHQAFRARGATRNQYCALGSVKTNVGHLDAAAGVTGVIKTVLALENETIPASLHFETANPEIDFANSPFFLNSSLRAWRSNGAPRRAGVSSFGMGGTNAHLIMEEAPARQARATSSTWHVIPLSASSAPAFDRALEGLAAHIERYPEIDFSDLAFTLQVGRYPLAFRRAFVCNSTAALLQALQRPGASAKACTESTVGIVFPGEAGQIPALQDLHAQHGLFRREFEDCAAVLRRLGATDFRAGLLGGRAIADPKERVLSAFVVQVALARFWAHFGVAAQTLLGIGVGEYAAAHIQGTLGIEAAAKQALRHAALAPRGAAARAGGDALYASLSRTSLPDLLMELGDGQLLAGAIARGLRAEPRLGVGSFGSQPASLSSCLGVLGQIWTAGGEIRWLVDETPRPRRVRLPKYPFEHARFALSFPTESATLLTERMPAAAALLPLAEGIRRIWEETLGLGEVNLDDDFYELGGDSVQAITFYERLRSELALEISLQAVFSATTLREALRLADRGSALLPANATPEK